MTSTTFSHRVIYGIGFLLIVAILGSAFYLEYVKGVDPCPLCLLQRFCMIVLGIIFFFGALIPFKKIGKCSIGILGFLISGCGITLATRQIWLQHAPSSQSIDCGASLQYLLHVLPWDQAIAHVFMGSAECSEVAWRFLGFSISEWSWLWFLFFGIVCLFQLMRRS